MYNNHNVQGSKRITSLDRIKKNKHTTIKGNFIKDKYTTIKGNIKLSSKKCPRKYVIPSILVFWIKMHKPKYFKQDYKVFTKTSENITTTSKQKCLPPFCKYSMKRHNIFQERISLTHFILSRSRSVSLESLFFLPFSSMKTSGKEIYFNLFIRSLVYSIKGIRYKFFSLFIPYAQSIMSFHIP